MLSQYEAQTSLPFSAAELGAFHRFHAHDWDDDKEFQAGLESITKSQPHQMASNLLKIKQYYFSTRMDIKINLDDYLAWRKHLEQPSDDPNEPIFKRFDNYDFDADVKFQQGLPTFVSQLIKEGKSTLDKAALQKEMVKAKAFYYARFVELFDFPAYLAWKELAKSQQGPACPYAHLWQNKGKGSGNEMAEDSQKFLSVTNPISQGTLSLHLHSPATKNALTASRMAKVWNEIDKVETSEKLLTSAFWTANTGSSTLDRRDPDSQIVTKDEKWFCGGILSVTGNRGITDEILLRQYFSLVDKMSHLSQTLNKPVITIIDGMVALSSAYIAYGTGGQRVITQNATLSFTEPTVDGQVPNPFAGLVLLNLLQANTESRPIPKGTGLYLAFCPEYVLRGPDLKKLGLADFFIPATKIKDVEEAVKSVTGCPPPHTVQAVRMALNAEVVYPGPAKIDVWKQEVEECFGESTSMQDMVARLEKHENAWSKSIREHIAGLEPVYAKVLYRAVVSGSQLESPREMLRLEYRLRKRYLAYIAASRPATEQAMDEFFEGSVTGEDDLFNFGAKEIAKFGLLVEAEDKDILVFEETGVAASATAAASKVTIATPSAEDISACPYLSSKQPNSQDRVRQLPADHPMVGGMSMGMDESACPFLNKKKDQEAKQKDPVVVPTDHPVVPGMKEMLASGDVSGCPFLSAKKKREEEAAAVAKVAVKTDEKVKPEDHPVMKEGDAGQCPFLSAGKNV